MEEWLDYYEWILDYILELNREGVQIMEGTAATFLKLLTDTDPFCGYPQSGGLWYRADLLQI